MEDLQPTGDVTALEQQQLDIAADGQVSFWHRVRFELVGVEARRHGAATLVDLGAGSGLLGDWAARRLPDLGYRWTELSPVLADRLRDRHGAATEIRSGEPLPPGSLVALLDVLEHIDDDVAAMRAIAASMSPSSVLVVTVPAVRALFSSWDVALGHHRRYSRRMLRHVLEDAGLRVVRCDALFPELLPLAVRRLVDDRRAGRRGTPGAVPGASSADFPTLAPWVDRTAYAVARSSSRLRRIWPLGTSLIAVAVPLPEGTR